MPLLCNYFVKLYIFLKIHYCCIEFAAAWCAKGQPYNLHTNEKALSGLEGHVLELMSVCNSLPLWIDKVALGGLLAVRHVADFRELEVYKCKFQFI